MFDRLINNLARDALTIAARSLFLAIFVGFFSIPESLLTDMFFKLRQPIEVSDEIIIIGLDEEFARQRGYHPEAVPRDYLTRLLTSLRAAEVSCVGIYYDFMQSDTVGAALLQVVRDFGEKAIVFTTIDTSAARLLPLHEGIDSLVSTGFREIPQGRPRRFLDFLYLRDSIEKSFAVKVLEFHSSSEQIASAEPVFDTPPVTGRQRKPLVYSFGEDLSGPVHRLNYAGGLKRFTHFNSEEFLNRSTADHQKLKQFAGKIVIIGPTDPAAIPEEERMGIATPFGALPDVVLQANILNNLLTGNYLVELPLTQQIVLCIGTFLLAIFLIWKFKVSLGLGLSALLAVAYLLFAFLAFERANLALPVLWPLRAIMFGCMLAFVIPFTVQWIRTTVNLRRQFLDFHLLIEHLDGRRYRLRLLQAPYVAGNAKSDITFRPSPEFSEKLRRLHNSDNYSDPGGLQVLGTELYNILMPPDIKQSFVRSIAQAQTEKKGLRLRLRFDAPDLQCLPWEYMFDPGSKRFLATDLEILLSRYVESNQPRYPIATKELHVLIVRFNPVVKAGGNVPGETGADEELPLLIHKLDKLAGHSKIRIRKSILEHAVPSLITEKINEGVHIVHFIGHSSFDGKDGRIRLEDEDYQEVQTSASDFAALFAGNSEVRLVVLNTCKGATTSGLPEISGLAYHLIEQGISAVAAMQFNMPNETALVFASHFYESLANHYPIDFAMSKARRAIDASFAKDYPVDFGIPVLFLRSDDARLIEEDISRPG